MTNLIIEKLLAKTKRTDIPEFVPGDSIRVHVKIKEGETLQRSSHGLPIMTLNQPTIKLLLLQCSSTGRCS